MAVINYPWLPRLINSNKTWNATILHQHKDQSASRWHHSGHEGETDKQAEEANLNYSGCIYRVGLAVLLQIYQIMERIE